MNLLWIFAAVAPLGLASLFVFAMHIDPLSCHWRMRQVSATTTNRRALPRLSALSSGPCRRHCLQRITIERFLMFAPKIPPNEPPAVAPLSASFEITS